eukprot:2513422-Rhodomonas_salina.4
MVAPGKTCEAADPCSETPGESCQVLTPCRPAHSMHESVLTRVCHDQENGVTSAAAPRDTR